MKTAVYCFINKGMLASAGHGFTFDLKDEEQWPLCIRQATQLIEDCVCPCGWRK